MNCKIVPIVLIMIIFSLNAFGLDSGSSIRITGLEVNEDKFSDDTVDNNLDDNDVDDTVDADLGDTVDDNSSNETNSGDIFTYNKDKEPIISDNDKEKRKREIRRFSKRIFSVKKGVDSSKDDVEEETEESSVLEKELIRMNPVFTEKLLSKEKENYVKKQLNSYIIFIEEKKSFRVEIEKEKIKEAIKEDIDLNDFLNSIWLTL